MLNMSSNLPFILSFQLKKKFKYLKILGFGYGYGFGYKTFLGLGIKHFWVLGMGWVYIPKPKTQKFLGVNVCHREILYTFIDHRKYYTQRLMKATSFIRNSLIMTKKSYNHIGLKITENFLILI